MLEAIDAVAAIDARGTTEVADRPTARTVGATASPRRGAGRGPPRGGARRPALPGLLPCHAGRRGGAVHPGRRGPRRPRQAGVPAIPTSSATRSRDTPAEVVANWEALKQAEKGRTSVTEGIPAALPALALAAKLQRKALAVGMVLPGGGRRGGPAWPTGLARLATAERCRIGPVRAGLRRGAAAGPVGPPRLGDAAVLAGQRGPRCSEWIPKRPCEPGTRRFRRRGRSARLNRRPSAATAGQGRAARHEFPGP